MTGRWGKVSGLTVIGLCCFLAGCGAYGPSVVQGSNSDTPLEQGVGQRFQKLVPSGTTVENVRCTRPRAKNVSHQCEIVMIRSRPDRNYTYEVFAGHTVFHAYISKINHHETWTPPAIFQGGY